MKAAYIYGTIGAAAVWFIGGQKLGLDLKTLAVAVAASNCAGLIAIVLTLQAEWRPWLRKHVLNRSLKTWSLLALLYFSILLALVPELRSARAAAYLALPLILTTGLAAIPLFGPIQDLLVRRAQRRAIEKK